MPTPPINPELLRLQADSQRIQNWKRWGPYLSERQWGTVREDYSANGDCWNYFPHDHARSRAYRWGEDGLLGICDRECRLCFSIALWNGRDPILKERLFGLTNPQGNHGEDVKEVYFYLDSTPTHSYLKALYKYPQARFPYEQLVDENARRSRADPEFELADTGIFNDNKYFDILAEYAKASPDDILIKITATNRSDSSADLHLLPTLFFRNTWAWGQSDGEDHTTKPRVSLINKSTVSADHPTLGRFMLHAEPMEESDADFLFTENETNLRLFKEENYYPHVKDAFHEYVVHGHGEAVNHDHVGTKCAAYHAVRLPAGASVTLRLRLRLAAKDAPAPFTDEFEKTFQSRIAEADTFYDHAFPHTISSDERQIVRQASAGLLWSKQFYNYVVEEWLQGDPAQPRPPKIRKQGRNSDWRHLYNRDVISMPDKWEYPWYATWDLAFQMIPFATLDPDFAKSQLLLFLREWYMHPNGQLPAYEFNFSDVNPPVHAWACWRLYKMTGQRHQRDIEFLARTFQKLLMNFTWWVNRKDATGKHLFSGGFLGLDNVGIFDRSQPLPNGALLEQADGTAWMAFYCSTMLSMALELAQHDSTYEDIASKFFEHFVAIVDAMNSLGGSGLWDATDGFYYDQIRIDGKNTPLRIRSCVGIIPLFACEILEQRQLDRLPGFTKRMRWFLDNRKDLAHHISYVECSENKRDGMSHFLLALPSRDRLINVLKYVLSEQEFLSPHGIRSLSASLRDHPYVFRNDGKEYTLRYEPGESQAGIFGGNSNWRGPIWIPLNYLLIEALERYHHFYGDSLQVEFPTGSGQMLNLQQVASELSRRLESLFLPDANGNRPFAKDDPLLARPEFKDLLLFHEYFNGDNGRGLGASHQTGWTALITRLIDNIAVRAAAPSSQAGTPAPPAQPIRL